MSEKLSDLLDLELAWKKVKQDISNRVFIKNPFEVSLIEEDLGKYLNKIEKNIDENAWHPKPNYICNVPKEKGLIRPGSHLFIDDRIVLSALITACLPAIYDTLEWAQGIKDFSYQLLNDFNNTEWFENRFEGWENFRKQSLLKLEDGYSHVIIADITGYYENIDIMTLISDLRSTGASGDAINLLSTCLNRWAHINGRGIPQGYSSSDILGKLYLNTVDLNLSAMNYEHIRYVDDFRVFCKSLSEAKKALMQINSLLRKRGLNLQSAKSKIYSSTEAKIIIDGIQPILQPIIEEFMQDITDALKIDNPYFSVAAADEALKDMADETPVEVLKNASKIHLIDSSDFDKTLFRFLLNRLGSSKDNYMLSHSLAFLESHPEETTTILKYIASLECFPEVETQIFGYIKADTSVYSYQIYQIFNWINDNKYEVSEEFLSFIRSSAFERSNPHYLKTVCRTILGRLGNNADFERMEQLYNEIDDEKERSELVCCLNNMERTRRNSFLSRAKYDGELISRASNLVRNNRLK